MPVKIRLQRHGKKGKPYFWIIAADSRSKRDGKFLEKLGFYNPTTNPAQIDLDVDSAVKWLQNGAQPTDTARAILSYKGALMKNHLAGGVRKGALTEEQAEAKFNEWLEQKSGSIDHKKATLSEAKDKAKAEKLAAEKAVNEKRAADAAAAAAPAEEVSEEAEVETEAAETASEETPATEVETTEAAAEETTEEEKEA
ncbi:30S ribosomal protein S16 [Aequorivita soesokkakensis]|uniref:Small ribosomal subunit protein bS16 n=1 Tax=Aequorivita soesokkakensis TaxID=1385699 RepID=A0A1A9LDE7_9FLAO|nr:30S ribosomal protein S16 [Aequorivita soesokkakensis]OAD91399.1 30S ribosomal protein S16 [Aequorivita soesokkakensis]